MTTALASRILLAVAASVSLGIATASAGVVDNGDFSDTSGSPFRSWSTDPFFPKSPTATSGAAQFQVEGLLLNTGSFVFNLIQLQQEFELPSDATTLSFEFSFSTAGTPLTSAAGDVFEASLFDTSGSFNTLSSINDSGIDPFFAYELDGFESSPEVSKPLETFTRNGDTWNRVTLDVSGISQQDVILEFLMTGDDDGLTTTVLLDNVVLNRSSGNVIPEPTTFAMWSVLAVGVVPFRRRSRR